MLHLETGLEQEPPRTDWQPGPRTRPAYTPAETAAMTRRLGAILRACSPAELDAGRRWYDDARAFCAELDPDSPERAAGIVAALSPRNPWAKNRRDAAAILDWIRTDDAERPRVHTSALQGQAERIAYRERPLDVLGGPKVRAFYRNLTGDLDAVTVDVWMARAAGAPRVNGAPTPAQCHAIGDVIRRLARRAGMEPAHAQAAIWIHVRGSAD